MSDSTPYNMPKEPGRWRAIFLATLVHAALFGLLWFGIRWQSEEPVAVEAEVWSPQARQAAPRPEPEPQREVKPEPKPEEPKPVIKEEPKPPVVEQPVDKPDIALEQEKKRIEEKKRLEEEQRQERERQEKQRQEKERQEQERQQKQRQEQERKEKERQERERQQKIAEQKAEEKRIEKEKQEKLAAARKKAEAEELKKKLAAEKAAAEKLQKEKLEAEERAAEKRHQENLERMTAQAGAGNAPRAQAGRPDPGYGDRVAAKIKSNTIFNVPGALSGNPPVEYEVQLLPDGSLRGIRKVRSSGVPGFDEAVARAIERSSPFPPDRSGVVPPSFNVIHRPKDQ